MPQEKNLDGFFNLKNLSSLVKYPIKKNGKNTKVRDKDKMPLNSPNMPAPRPTIKLIGTIYLIRTRSLSEIFHRNILIRYHKAQPGVIKENLSKSHVTIAAIPFQRILKSRNGKKKVVKAV